MSALEKIAEIEHEMSRTQKNKATNSHLGLLKAKLAKLRQSLMTDATKSGGGGGQGFEVQKSGDARVGLIGFPSVGKSTLLEKLTGAESEVADYEFTTLTCVPGILNYKGAKVQILDLPGIIEGAKDGKGRGKQVISAAMSCSLILIVLDVTKPGAHREVIEKELEGFGMRLNKKPPNIVLTRKEKGGGHLNIAPGCELIDTDEETIEQILKEYRVHNYHLAIRCNATADDIIDVIEGNRRYMPCLYVMNKIDQIPIEELAEISTSPFEVPISAQDEWNIDELKDVMWERMQLIRVYTRQKGEEVDYDEPVILHFDKRTVQDFCRKIHKDILEEFKNALVWGKSAKHDAQTVGKDHILEDEDIVQIVKDVKKVS